MAQRPELLCPRDVADFPERRINDRQARPDHLPVVEIGDQGEGARAKLAHGCDQLAHAHGGGGTGGYAEISLAI